MSLKFFKWAYAALSVAAAVALGISFFTEVSPTNQITFLIQAVGFGFVSGLGFGGDI